MRSVQIQCLNLPKDRKASAHLVIHQRQTPPPLLRGSGAARLDGFNGASRLWTYLIQTRYATGTETELVIRIHGSRRDGTIASQLRPAYEAGATGETYARARVRPEVMSGKILGIAARSCDLVR